MSISSRNNQRLCCFLALFGLFSALSAQTGSDNTESEKVAPVQSQQKKINLISTDGRNLCCPTREIKEITIESGSSILNITTAAGDVLTWDAHDIDNLEFATTVAPIVNYVQPTENEPMRHYLEEVTYDPNDYTYTLVDRYYNTSERLDWPLPLTIRLENNAVGLPREAMVQYPVVLSKTMDFEEIKKEVLTDNQLLIWNTIPGDTLFYRILDMEETTVLQQGYALGIGQVRSIYAPSVDNIRDLGGWPVEGGGHLRYGCFFRGGKLHQGSTTIVSDEDIVRLRDLGIKVEYDMRGHTEANDADNANRYSRLGTDITYTELNAGCRAYMDLMSKTDNVRYQYNAISSAINNHRPIFFHCSRGCDRAGTWAFLLEGVCGVSEENLVKDYELSCFAGPAYIRQRNIGYSNPDVPFHEMMEFIKGQEGETLRDKFEHYMVDLCGISLTNINKLRDWLVIPDEAPSIPNQDHSRH